MKRMKLKGKRREEEAEEAPAKRKPGRPAKAKTVSKPGLPTKKIATKGGKVLPFPTKKKVGRPAKEEVGAAGGRGVAAGGPPGGRGEGGRERR